MENKVNMVKCATHGLVSKEDLIKAINKAFPDDDILIASVTTVETTNGTKTQSVCFGKILDV